MIKIPSFRHLQVVAAVAQSGGVRGATTRVNLSQPAVSQAVLSVERAIGEALFDRSARGMFPTEAGKLFARRIDRAIGYLKSATQAMAANRAARRSGERLLDRLATTIQLRSLVEVIEHGGYAPAARHLGVTQPNVHRAIGQLEKLTGSPLFQASRFGATPTPDALVLARCTRLAFREIDVGLEELRELRGLQDGSVVIGALPLLRTRILPIAVTRLLSRYPDANVTIVEAPYGEQLNRLHHGRIDLLIGALRNLPPNSDLQNEELFQEPLSVVVRAGHPLLRDESPSPADLVELEWIAPPAQTPAGVHFASFFHRHDLPLPRRIIECGSFVITRDLLIRSDRAALLSTSQIHHEMLADELKIAVAKIPGTERPIGVCTRTDWSPTRIQSHFLLLVRTTAGERDA